MIYTEILLFLGFFLSGVIVGGSIFYVLGRRDFYSEVVEYLPIPDDDEQPPVFITQAQNRLAAKDVLSAEVIE